MKSSGLYFGALVVGLTTLLLLVACTPGEAAVATATPEPMVTLPAATAMSMATPIPTTEPTATVEPPPQPTAAPTSTPVPSPTADLSGVGLPCPAVPPAKPDYVRYVLSAAPWPTPDPGAEPPPLSLSDPLPAAGRNTGYSYGSDGSGRYLLHNGLDMTDANAAPAGAVADGTVIIARDDLGEMFGWRCDWYGMLVVIRLDMLWNERPVYALYGHIQDVEVSEGQRVMRGDPVAREGTAGVAVVRHLHLEIRAGENRFGATQNPLLWIEPWSGSGIIAGRLVDPDGRAWHGVTVTLIDRSGESDFLNTWTYLDDPDHLIRPDPSLAENFVFGPVAAGTYDVYIKLQDVAYRQTVEVKEGQINTVEIVTEPYRTPTPEATP